MQFATDVLAAAVASPATTAAYVGGAAIAVIAASKLAASASASKKVAAMRARTAAQKKDHVHLFQFPDHPTALHISPFCGSIETFVRLAEIPHTVVAIANPSFSPTGRFPYMELNGVGTADSDSILKRLAEAFPDKCAAPQATTADLAASLMVRKMVLHATRLHYIRWVWVDHAEVPIKRIADFIPLPFFVSRRLLLGKRADNITMLNLEGQGDLSDAEYHAQFLDEMVALETIIADPKITLTREAEAAAFAVFEWLLGLRIAPPCPAVAYMTASKPIGRFLARIEREAFPDAASRSPKRPIPAYLTA